MTSTETPTLGVPYSNYYSIAITCIVTITLFALQDGHTALRTASFNGQHKVVELLLGAGANPDLQDKVYCIALIFRGSKFLQMVVFKDFAEMISRIHCLNNVHTEHIM